MVLRRITLTALLLIFALAACAGRNETPQTAIAPAPAEPVATTRPTEMAETAVPTPIPQPTVTPQPTPILPSITVRPQPLTADGRLVIETVVSSADGWLALYRDAGGRPGDLLGYTAVRPGENESLTLDIEAQAATPLLHARLHIDAGDSGEFEFPGPDTAVERDGSVVSADFAVEIQLPIPQIVVEDQTIGPDGVILVDSLLATEPGWLIIHALHEGRLGPALGQVAVPGGPSEDVSLPIRWRQASSELAAVLYEDPQQPGGFDAAQDLPVLVGGEPVSERFAVTLPPDIAAYEQPVINGQLSIERASSPVPAWIVVYTVEDGQLGLIIGFAAIDAGVNEQVAIDVVETAVTPELFLLLHDNSTDPGEFDFPAGDLPLTYDEQLVPPVILGTNPGNYLITRDQTLGEDERVIVPLVVSDLDVWLAIYTVGADGQADEALGEVWLPAGINRDNEVTLRARVTGEPLLAVLQRDAGTPRTFDYPDGEDAPLLRNRQVIQSPFTLSEPSGTDAFNPGS